ncbi:unnamed protein product [Mortierella alpina]
MRFPTLPLIFTLSAILTATTCHGQGTYAPSETPAEATELDHPRIVYSKESKSPVVVPSSSSGPAQMMETAADDPANTNPLRRRRRRHLYDLGRHEKRQHDSAPLEQHRLRNFKRQTPRRLAGEKREGGLLNGLVGEEDLVRGLARPAGTTSAQDSSPSEDVQSKSGSIHLTERQEAEDESATQDGESGTAEDESNSDATEQKSAASGLDPLGQALEDVTKSSDGSETSSSPAPSEDTTDSASTTTTTEEVQPTSTAEESSSQSAETPESQDTVPPPSPPPPTDPVVSILSNDDGTENDSGVDMNGPSKVAPTTAGSEPPAAAAAEPTTHTANAAMDADAASEANKEGAKTSILIGVVAAALLLAAALGVWIVRKLKLSPSRQFRGKMGSGGKGAAGGGVNARNNYGPGHEDGSDYNSYDEFYRGPESPLPMMAHAAGPSVIGGMVLSSHHATEEEDGVGRAYPSQNLAHMSMSSESMTDYQQYSYGEGYAGTTGAGLAVPLPVVAPAPLPSTIGGLPVVGHNVHKYGSEDYSQNTHFLRELRE